MVKKANPSKNPGGRPARDPDTLRTERLVVRIHPDLMRTLTEMSAENGITRSLLVERCLVEFVNLSKGRAVLDFMGRELKGEPREGVRPLGTPESFRSIWRRAIGGDPAQPRTVRHPPDYEPPNDEDR